MLAPLEQAKVPEADSLHARECTLVAAIPPFENDRVPAGLIARMTVVPRPSSPGLLGMGGTLRPLPARPGAPHGKSAARS